MTDITFAETVDAPETDRDFDDRLQLVLLVIEDLFSAVFMAAAAGRTAHVEVPDERTATLFRTALKSTDRYRPAERLVSFVVRG